MRSSPQTQVTNPTPTPTPNPNPKPNPTPQPPIHPPTPSPQSTLQPYPQPPTPNPQPPTPNPPRREPSDATVSWQHRELPPPAPPLSRRPRPGCVLDPRACAACRGRARYSRALCGVRSCVRCAAARRAARLELPSVGTPGLLWLAPRPREGPPPARLRLLRPLLGREDDLARVAVVRVVARLVRAHARDVRRRALRGLPLVPRHALVAANAEQAPPPPPRDLVEEEGVW